MIKNDYESEESHKAEHALNPNTRINLDRLNDQILRERIDSLGEEIPVSREIWQRVREMLDHRDGTLYEDIAFVNCITHKSEINKEYDYYDEKLNISRCKPNAPMRAMLKEADPFTIIGIHNYPQSHVPSEEDLDSARRRRYKYGLVICHNGLIFKYFVNDEKFSMSQSSFFLDLLEKALYNEDEKKISNTLICLKNNGVEMEVLR